MLSFQKAETLKAKRSKEAGVSIKSTENGDDEMIALKIPSTVTH